MCVCVRAFRVRVRVSNPINCIRSLQFDFGAQFRPIEGMELIIRETHQQNFCFPYHLKLFRMVQATPWAEFAVIGVQLC